MSKTKPLGKRAMRLQGRITWLNVLLRQQRYQEAQEWAKKHKLPLPVSTDSIQSAAAQAAFGAGSAAPTVNSYANESASAVAQAPTVASLTTAYSGGAGVQRLQANQDLDRSAPTVENPQLASPAVQLRTSGGQLPSGDGASASPSGELEGMGKSRQADSGDKSGLFSNRLESGWVVSGEGVVWGKCANRWFVQVDVGGRQAKAAVGEAVLQRGDRVRVRLEWVSADGRDAEYAIVGRLGQDEAVVAAAPVPGPEMAVKAEEGVPDEGVPVIKDEPIAPELVAEMQKALGLAEEPSQAEEASENAQDFFERMRQEAYRAYSG